MKKLLNKYGKVSMECLKGGREANQDFVAQLDCSIGKLLILCDGAGGHKGGRVASEATVDYIFKNIEKLIKNGFTEPKVILTKLALETNALLLHISETSPELKGLMTTMVIGLVSENELHVVHAGDSRLFVLRNGDFIFQTKDHSYVQELVDKGELSLEEAITHEKSNIITNGIGKKNNFYSTYNKFYLKKDDLILLTSDGVHGLISNNEILNLLKLKKSISRLSSELSEYCDKQGEIRKRGKHDNIGVLLYKHKFEKSPIKKIVLPISLIAIFGILGFMYLPNLLSSEVDLGAEIAKQEESTESVLVSNLDSLKSSTNKRIKELIELKHKQSSIDSLKLWNESNVENYGLFDSMMVVVENEDCVVSLKGDTVKLKCNVFLEEYKDQESKIEKLYNKKRN